MNAETTNAPTIEESETPPSTIETTTTTARHPIDLDPADLPCADCGRRVAGPIPVDCVEYVEITARVTKLGVRDASAEEAMTVCQICVDRRALADDLTARLLPDGIARDGLRVFGRQAAAVVRNGLAGLAIVGARMPDRDRCTRADLLGIVRRLAPAATQLSWSARFAPVRHGDAIARTANRCGWQHVTDDALIELQRARVDLMADKQARTAPPVPIAPPLPSGGPAEYLSAPGGCLICGISAISVAAARVAANPAGARGVATDLWTERAVDPAALGGRSAPKRLRGHTCPDCTRAIEEVGAVGPTAIERALARHLGLARRWTDGQVKLPGLKGWGALAADALRTTTSAPEPNTSAWAHIANLDALADRLRLDLGIESGGV